jgi:hypothetical protein
MGTSCETVLTQWNLWIFKNEWNFVARSEIVGLIKKVNNIGGGRGRG